MPFFILFVTDILLGFVPQATGCAVCLFAVANQKLASRSFLYTSLIYSAIAVVVRVAYNYGLIDFGFHTIIIWMIFIVVALAYNRLPPVKATVSILISGVIITVSELITCVILMAAIGQNEFNAIMNNTLTTEGKIDKAICGIPANLLFFILVLVLYRVLMVRRQKRIDAKENNEAEEADA